MSLHYPVNEIFQTLQGEGCQSGRAAIFVRLQGCPVGCPWCDTRHTWVVTPERQVPAEQVLDRSSQSDGWARMDSQAILHALQQLGYTAKLVVITGGEPCLYDLRPLSGALLEAGYEVQLETSGTQPILIHPAAWVTVSPKVAMKGDFEVLDDALARADEIKHPVAREKHIEELDALLARRCHKPNVQIALQPISQQRQATALAIRTCIERNWRLSAQLHKYLQID